MGEWTKQRHADERIVCKGSGSKNRELGAALDEIERLEAERDKLREVYEAIKQDMNLGRLVSGRIGIAVDEVKKSISHD